MYNEHLQLSNVNFFYQLVFGIVKKICTLVLLSSLGSQWKHSHFGWISCQPLAEHQLFYYQSRIIHVFIRYSCFCMYVHKLHFSTILLTFYILEKILQIFPWEEKMLTAWLKADFPDWQQLHKTYISSVTQMASDNLCLLSDKQ